MSDAPRRDVVECRASGLGYISYDNAAMVISKFAQEGSIDRQMFQVELLLEQVKAVCVELLLGAIIELAVFSISENSRNLALRFSLQALVSFEPSRPGYLSFLELLEILLSEEHLFGVSREYFNSALVDRTGITAVSLTLLTDLVHRQGCYYYRSS